MSTLKIRLHNGLIHIKATNEDRLTHHGFGTFLENVDPAEIDISTAALSLILEQPERSGLQGLEFWPDNRIAWASPTPEIFVAPEDVNVPPGARNWLKKMSDSAGDPK